MSLTPDPLLLNTERLHRVDTSQLQHGSGASGGYCRTDLGQCHGHPDCADHNCQGHPCNDEQPEERDGPLLGKVVLGYAAILAACAWATWQWLSR